MTHITWLLAGCGGLQMRRSIRPTTDPSRAPMLESSSSRMSTGVPSAPRCCALLLGPSDSAAQA